LYALKRHEATRPRRPDPAFLPSFEKDNAGVPAPR
jgi:hypothetical protein